MKNVTVYMGPMCAFCDAAKRLLNKKNIPYKEINIALDESKLNEMLKNPTHLTEMGKRAQNAAEKKFNWNSEKEKLHKFYHKLLNE